jgi:hypothetical protein
MYYEVRRLALAGKSKSLSTLLLDIEKDEGSLKGLGSLK